MNFLKMDSDTKLVFLDIDGVLNNGIQQSRMIEAMSHTVSNFEFHPEFTIVDRKNHRLGSWLLTSLVDKLHDFCKQENAIIIGVSSWFLYRHDVEEFRKYTNLPIVDRTNRCGGNRHIGILEYLKKYNTKQFVILDDSLCSEGMYSSEFAIHGVNIHGRIGITDENFSEAKVKINEKRTY